MTKNDIERVIISILEKGPSTPENILKEIKKYENLSRPTFYRYWKKLKKDRIRELTKDEIKEYGLEYSKKNKYYVLIGYIIEDKKEILMETLKTVNIKNVTTLLDQIGNYLSFLNKSSEYMDFLEFYDKMKEILDQQSFDNILMKYDNILMKYTDYFIIVVNNLIKKYKNYQNSKTNPFEDSYIKATGIASRLFEDYLDLFNKGANRPEIIFPLMDMLYKMGKLSSFEKLVEELEKRENIAMNVIQEILIRYLKYNEKKLKDNLNSIKEKSKFHYKKYLENNSPRDKMLSDIYDQILKEFKYYD
ncbi:MAG: hypothetical protein ACPLW7_00370 [Minisyncoccia bacterium]|jgi:predicted transcriptional regulator